MSTSDEMKDWQVDAMATMVGAKLDHLVFRDQDELEIPRGEGEYEQRRRLRRWTGRLRSILESKPSS